MDVQLYVIRFDLGEVQNVIQELQEGL